MTPIWKNDLVEAWLLEDGTLIVKRKVKEPTDGHGHYYLIDTLPKVESPKSTKAA